MNTATKPSKLAIACSLACCTQISSGSAAGLEEVVVTAEIREQSLQDIGLAVSGLYRDDLGDMRVDSFNDVRAMVADLDIKNTLGGLNKECCTLSINHLRAFISNLWFKSHVELKFLLTINHNSMAKRNNVAGLCLGSN